MLFYRTKNKKYFRGYGFLSFARKLSKKYGKQLDVAKTYDKRIGKMKSVIEEIQ